MKTIQYVLFGAVFVALLALIWLMAEGGWVR